MSGEESLSLQVRRGVVLTAVQQRGVSSSTLLSFAAAAFMVRAVMLMLGPLLVASIAVAGQLAAAMFVTWGITAPLVGPISDTYGRRPVLLIGVLLMALGVLGSGAAWSYGSLMATRLITGVGSAMLPPTIMAALADNLPPEKVGKAVGFITASSWVGLALGAGDRPAWLYRRMASALLHHRWLVTGPLGDAMVLATPELKTIGSGDRSPKPFQGHRPPVSAVVRAHR